jgi:hypothetical protein
LALGESTAPALRQLDNQCLAEDTHVNKGAVANYYDDSLQAAMTDQNDRYLVLDAVEFGEVFIMPVRCVN